MSQGPERMTSGKRNPKPGTFVQVRTFGPSDYVFVGSYRIKALPTKGWYLYIAEPDGRWGRPRYCRTKRDAERIVQEHLGKGSVEAPRINLQARVARLEKQVADLTARAHKKRTAMKCPRCYNKMRPEHAHYRCDRCGHVDHCCEGHAPNPLDDPPEPGVFLDGAGEWQQGIDRGNEP